MNAWPPGIALALATVMATGQTLYVSDQLVITVRAGSSTENLILTNLVSGDAVEVLQADAEGDYTRIRTQSGTEGWALSHYLVERPIFQDRLVIAERDLADAQVRIATLERSVATSTEELEGTSRRLESVPTFCSPASWSALSRLDCDAAVVPVGRRGPVALSERLPGREPMPSMRVFGEIKPGIQQRVGVQGHTLDTLIQ